MQQGTSSGRDQADADRARTPAELPGAEVRCVTFELSFPMALDLREVILAGDDSGGAIALCPA